MASTTFIIGDQSGEVNEGSTPLQVQVTITEVADVEGGSGTDLRVDLEVIGGNLGDLRGFFFNVANFSEDLQVFGADVTDQEIEDDGVTNVPPGDPNINPFGPFDVGVELGDDGIGGGDDIQSTTFYITAGDDNLTLADLALQQIGIRATSVGEAGSREGSTKLAGVVPPNGEEELGSIAGFKYEDIDGDGVLDDDEGGLSGWTIELYLDEDTDGVADPGELVDTTTTGLNGAYIFDSLEAGDYIVVEDTDVPGWTSIGLTQHEVALGEGEDLGGYNFFNQPPDGGGGGGGGENNWESNIDYFSDFTLVADVSVNNEWTDVAAIDHTVVIDTSGMDGNVAEANVDVQAFGESTYTKLDMVVWTQGDYLSSIQAHAYSATDDASPIEVVPG